MTRTTLARSVLLFTVASTVAAQAAPSHDINLPHVRLRPGVHVDLHLAVLDNPRRDCDGDTIFTIHGAFGNATNWTPLAQAMFAGAPTSRTVCRVIALDLPGHGRSSLPTGLPFQDLTYDDYVTSVLESFAALAKDGIRPGTIMGESAGSVIVQLVQQTLLARKSSLRELHVKHAVLMASNLPRALHWSFSDDGIAAQIVPAFEARSAQLGNTSRCRRRSGRRSSSLARRRQHPRGRAGLRRDRLARLRFAGAVHDGGGSARP